MKKNVIYMCLMLCISLIGMSISFNVRASVTEKENSKVIKIGYIDYEGFVNKKENGSFSGYGVDYLNKISEYTGWTYEYIYDSWDNQFKNLESGKIDFICHAQKTAEREEKYLFSKYSIGSESSVLYSGSDDDRYYYNDFENFNNITVAVLKNSFQNPEMKQYAKEKGFHVNFKEYDTQEACFAALADKKVDAVAMGSLAFKKGYKIICKFGSDPFYFMSNKNNTEKMNTLDDALSQINANDPSFTSDLFKQYYGNDGEGTDLLLTRQEYEYIKNSDKITVGLIPNRRPFSYTNDKGECLGITKDIMELIEKRTGLKMKYEMMAPGQKVTDYLSENPADLVAGPNLSNPQFESEDYLTTDAYYKDDVSLVCQTGKNYDYNAKEDSYILVIPNSYAALESYVKENYPQFKITKKNTGQECLKEVREGRADFTVQNVNVLRPMLQDPRNENLMILPTFFMNENMGVISLNTGHNKILTSIIDKAIATLSEEEIDQITVNESVSNGYRLSGADMIYKFRYALACILVLVLMLVIGLVMWQNARKRSLALLEEKNDQLRDAVAQADNANRAKSQFLARMSHEIRTPMNAIVGLTTIAQSHEEEPEKIDEYLGKIKVSSKVLLNIINDVLDMSAIESDKIKIGKAPFSIRETLTSISTIYYPQCSQKHVRFEMNTAEIVDEHLLGDGLRLNQILLNLISNAYKFTPTGGEIIVTGKEITVKDGIAFYQFSVADTGEGMSEEMQERLFKPFEQETAQTAQKHGGSGLGLSIAKNLVEMMNGSISFTSKKGEGTTFLVSIPFEIDKGFSEADMSKHKLVRALIVDDEDDTREYTALILDRVGVPYAVAKNGKEALEKLSHAKELGTGYDLCFVDWKMPDMNGGEVAKKIREYFEKDTLVIIVSAYNTAEIRDEAEEAGVDMFLTKPLFQSTVFNLLMQISGGQYVKQNQEEEEDYDFGGRKILLAEDTDFNADVAIELLDMVNMKVDRAVNGKVAADLFHSAPEGTYCAILMDVQMPEMNGYEATRTIRAMEDIPWAKTIPIYAMTADAFTEDVSSALNAGMNGHIAKPIDTKILYSTLQGIVNAEKNSGVAG